MVLPVVVHPVMGDQTEMALAGGLQDAMAERMRREGICRATSRNSVRGNIVSALAGDGIVIPHAGRSAQVRAAKKSAGERAPFFIFRAVATEEVA